MHASAVSSWNGTTAGNPASGTGGVSIAAITGPYYAACWANSNVSGGGAFIGNFGASAYQIVTNGGSVPAGFGNW